MTSSGHLRVRGVAGRDGRADRRMKRLKMVSADSRDDREVDSGEPIWIIGRLRVTRAPVTTPR